MTKLIKRDALSGRFIVGRGAAEKFNEVEGLRLMPRTSGLLNGSDRRGESGEIRRKRILAAFAAKS